jgi:xanthine dehydrogenase accessory factor
MKKKLVIWELIEWSLRHHVPVMLLYVLQSEGSSPGRKGFFMAVNSGGEMAGSIGGGIMEYKFVEMAKELLRDRRSGLLRRQVHDKRSAKDQSGMICSGEQLLWVYHVQAADAVHVSEIIGCLRQHRNGMLQLSPAGLQFLEQVGDGGFMMQSEENWLYTEQVGYRDHLYLVGGGHCSLACARVMSRLDFYIHVYDDRAELNTLLENEVAHERVVVEDYGGLEGLIPEGENRYVVIMTMGYRSDEVVLKALLHKRFRYVGLLGSQAKIDKMFESIPSALTKHIHAPVGISIKSQTPEEIAISIAAEIIKERNG